VFGYVICSNCFDDFHLSQLRRGRYPRFHLPLVCVCICSERFYSDLWTNG
jgi:hypothetical protein